MAHFRKQLTNAAPHYYSVLLLFILFIKTLLKSPSPEILRHDDSHQMADNLGINKIQGQSPSLKSTDTLQKRTEIYSLQKFQFHWAHVRQAWKLYLSVAVLIHLGRLSIFCIFTKFWMGIYGIDWQCNIQIASGKQKKKAQQLSKLAQLHPSCLSPTGTMTQLLVWLLRFITSTIVRSFWNGTCMTRKSFYSIFPQEEIRREALSWWSLQ